jgi:hypothetical protein
MIISSVFPCNGLFGWSKLLHSWFRHFNYGFFPFIEAMISRKLSTLRFDNTNGFFVDEEDVIGRSDVRDVLPHRNANTSRKVDLRSFLHCPTASDQLFVDFVAGYLLSVLVWWRHCVGIEFISRGTVAQKSRQARLRAETIPKDYGVQARSKVAEIKQNGNVDNPDSIPLSRPYRNCPCGRQSSH